VYGDPGIEGILRQQVDETGSFGKSILDLLEQIELGELCPLSIPFRNDEIERITKIVFGVSDDSLISEISKKNEMAKSSDEFCSDVQRLYHKHRRDRGEMGIEFEELKRMYWRIRRSPDTFKAVYRLTLLGIVSDYVVDYNAKVITLEIVKRNPEEYLDNLKKYLFRWTVRSKVDSIMESLVGLSGNELIKQCAFELVRFVNGTMAEKRKEAIRHMAETTQGGINNSKYFRERLENYFHAKYVGELSKFSGEYTFEKIEEFWRDEIDDRGDWRSNLKHLRGTCDRLLESYPTNGAYKLLAFMSDFGLADSHRVMRRVFGDYEAIWELLIEDRAFDDMEIDNCKRWCEDTLLRYRQELDIYFASYFLKDCISWVGGCIEKLSGNAMNR
jgi:ATP-dependent DNA helicase RecQ